MRPAPDRQSPSFAEALVLSTLLGQSANKISQKPHSVSLGTRPAGVSLPKTYSPASRCRVTMILLIGTFAGREPSDAVSPRLAEQL